VNLSTETYAQKDLMVSLAHAGNHHEAVRLASAVEAKLPKDPGTLVDIANCYAIASTAALLPSRDRETHERYVAKALESLKRAIEAGYGDKVNLETEPDLDALRDRAEFKALVNGLPEP
jgi:hypothetical protein